MVNVHASAKERKKKCAKCFKVKLYSEFPPHSTNSTGVASYCRICRKNLQKSQRGSNVFWRLRHHISTRVEKQVNSIPADMYKKLPDYLGYSMTDLRKHLEDDLQAREGISVRKAIDQGYHLDHIHPLSRYDVKEITDQAFRDCWAVENLRFISAAENLAKGAKVLTDDVTSTDS